MKLIIQIPCFNEENSLPATLSALPRHVDGFDEVEWLVIDDGSIDNTTAVASRYGVDHILRIKKNRGLAGAFMAGLNESLKLGADVIVNTDGDNQYNAEDIPTLVKPILNGRAEMVIGERPINDIKHFSAHKKILQKIGSWVVRLISGTNVPDAPCGFRAFSREMAMHINVFNTYTYTIEIIIQAGIKNMSVTSIPIRVNDQLRSSRLIKSIFSYIIKSFFIMIRVFVIYQPFKFFLSIGLVLLSFGFAIGLRFLILYSQGLGQGHVQSLIFCAILSMMGFSTVLIAFLADLLAVNRSLLEEIQYKLKRGSDG